jgi:hypothetical protein
MSWDVLIVAAPADADDQWMLDPAHETLPPLGNANVVRQTLQA